MLVEAGSSSDFLPKKLPNLAKFLIISFREGIPFSNSCFPSQYDDFYSNSSNTRSASSRSGHIRPSLIKYITHDAMIIDSSNAFSIHSLVDSGNFST